MNAQVTFAPFMATIDDAFYSIPKSFIDKMQSEKKELQAKLDEKEKQLQELIKSNTLNQETISKLNKEITDLTAENKKLTDRIIALENEREIDKKRIDNLENESKTNKIRNRNFEGLVTLCEISTKINQKFKDAYKNTFNPGRRDCIPDIGKYVENPPTQNDDDYKFWEEFKKQFPGTTEPDFRSFYRNLNQRRAKAGAHTDISDPTITKEKFEIARKSLFPNETDDEKRILDHSRFILPSLYT
jgi:DNA repair exonuclease SbcCD ATPase subunit